MIRGCWGCDFIQRSAKGNERALYLAAGGRIAFGMDRAISYKGFNIRAFEQTPGGWLAEIRRATGGWIVVRSTGERREVLTTSAFRRTANEAIDFAIEAINGGGMK
jgi:hypothetical protein